MLLSSWHSPPPAKAILSGPYPAYQSVCCSHCLVKDSYKKMISPENPSVRTVKIRACQITPKVGFFLIFFSPAIRLKLTYTGKNMPSFCDSKNEDHHNTYMERCLYCVRLQSMVLRTFSDCTRCTYLTECDAHFSRGKHRHREGPDPCELVANTVLLDIYAGVVLS